MLFRNATLDDVSILKRILKSWEDYTKLHHEEINDELFIHEIKRGDLPPIKEASFEKFHLVIMVQEDEPIGYFSSYEGYPDQQTYYISMFVIDKKFRNQGKGKLALEMIEKNAAGLDFTKLGLGIHSKNIPALTYWIAQGFTEIYRVKPVDDYALIGVIKKI